MLRAALVLGDLVSVHTESKRAREPKSNGL
jgi:hypothetical protein